MKTVIQLDAYLFPLDFFYNSLIQALQSDDISRIAIAPATAVTAELLTKIRDEGYTEKQIFIYDKSPLKNFPFAISDYSDILIQKPQRYFIVSSKYLESITNRLQSYGVDNSLIIGPPAAFSELLPIKEAEEIIYKERNSRNSNYLLQHLSERDCVIVNCPTLFYDVNEKLRILREAFGLPILRITSTISPSCDPSGDVFTANFFDVFAFLKDRSKRSNILYVSVNPIWHLVMLKLLRSSVPDLKILVYIYDWLPLFCPPSQKTILQRFLQLPLPYIDSEYKVFEEIVEGDIVDAILYKDGDENLAPLAQSSTPRLFFAAYLPSRLYQPPPQDIDPPNRFIYLGKLFTSLDYVPELFSDAFLIEVFDTVMKQGFSIDVYHIDSPRESVEAYREYFRDQPRVRILDGKPLDVLLPEIAGRYHWGYLLNNYHDEFSLIKGHVEAAIPARIFSFLALGIPAVVSAELVSCAGFVERQGIGIAVPESDLHRLGSILREIDYAKMQEQVMRARDSLSLDRQQDRFIRFLRENNLAGCR